MKAREVIRILRAAGWQEVRQTGSHRIYEHPTKPGAVTVPDHGSKDIAPGTLASIWRQAGIKR